MNKGAKMELAGFLILEGTYKDELDLKQHLLTLFVHEFVHYQFSDHFEMLNAPKNQKKFLDERIALTIEVAIANLLANKEIKKWIK